MILLVCRAHVYYEKKDIIGMSCIRGKDGSLKVTSGEKMKA